MIGACACQDEYEDLAINSNSPLTAVTSKQRANMVFFSIDFVLFVMRAAAAASCARMVILPIMLLLVVEALSLLSAVQTQICQAEV